MVSFSAAIRKENQGWAKSFEKYFFVVFFEGLGPDGHDTLMMSPEKKPRKAPKSRNMTTATGRNRIMKTDDSSSEEETTQDHCRESAWQRTDLKSKGETSKKSRSTEKSSNLSDATHQTSRDDSFETGLTQMPPLRDRVRQRLNLEARSEASPREQQHSRSFTKLRTDKSLPTKAGTTARDKSGISVVNSDRSRDPVPVTSDRTQSIAQHNSRTLQSRVPDTGSDLRSRSPGAGPVEMQANVCSRSDNPRNIIPRPLPKEERIRLAKLKQEQFRRTHVTQQSTVVSVPSSTSCVPDFSASSTGV